MIIAFHVENFSYRGTEVATYDYAFYNQKILGNKSIIVYPRDRRPDMANIKTKFISTFESYEYDNKAELEQYIALKGIRAVYILKYGKNTDNIVSLSVPLLVHCVYDSSMPHGTVYASISESVSKGRTPIVPHIIEVDPTDGDFRKELNIPSDAIVFGRHGGPDTFNIDFVRDVIYDTVNNNSNIYFIFAVKPFIFDKQHPQIKFISEFSSPVIKRKFINTCDAMIHACSLGESFGLSVLEFSKCNKPVITFNGGEWNRQHLAHLGDLAVLYNDKIELSTIFKNWKEDTLQGKCNKDYTKICEKFKPENVMRQFDEVFLKIVKDNPRD